MFRKVIAMSAVLALIWAAAPVSLHAQQMKQAQTKDKPAGLKPVDINSASSTLIAGVGLDDATAKKIVDSRPFRNKRDLLTKGLITPEQYEKIKNLIVAKRPPKK